MNTALTITEPNFENNLVSVLDGTPTTTSLVVAEKFGKRHDHVLRDVDNLRANLEKVGAPKSQLPKIGELEIIDKNALGKNFTRRYFALDRTAFSLLVFGFTGDKALKFKLQFIEAFNAMEARLVEQDHSDLVDVNDTAALFSAVSKKMEQYGPLLNLMAPKKKLGLKVKRKSETITKVAKKLNLKFRALPDQLVAEGILEKRKSEPGYWVDSSAQQLFLDRGASLHVSDAGVEYLKTRIADGSLAVKCFAEYKLVKARAKPKRKPKTRPVKTETVMPVNGDKPFNFNL